MSEEGVPADLVSSVMSFYSSQLTSHATMIVGFLVAFFTLVQVRQSIPDVFFQFGGAGIISIVVYSLVRATLYGSLSGVLMNGSAMEFRDFRNSHPELLGPAQVHGFVNDQILQRTRVRGRFFKRRGQGPKGKRIEFWIQLPLIVSICMGIVAMSLMFGWSSLAVGSWSGIVITVEGLSLLFSRPSR